jgi:hypothetical protein
MPSTVRWGALYADCMRWAPVAGRALGLLVLCVLGWQIVARGLDFFRAGPLLRFIHGVDLIIHEAGHAIFLLFGQFLQALGGSLVEVAVPALCAGYFLWQRQVASFAVALFWTGETITDVAIYMADAPTMALPLVGGGHHDWRYLLSTLGLVGAARFLGTLTYGLGVLLVLTAIVILAVDLVFAWKRAGSRPSPR